MYAPVWIEDLLFHTSAKTLDFYQCLSKTFRSDQSLSRVRLFATPWIAARQASLF